MDISKDHSCAEKRLHSSSGSRTKTVPEGLTASTKGDKNAKHGLVILEASRSEHQSVVGKTKTGRDSGEA